MRRKELEKRRQELLNNPEKGIKLNDLKISTKKEDDKKQKEKKDKLNKDINEFISKPLLASITAFGAFCIWVLLLGGEAVFLSLFVAFIVSYFMFPILKGA